MSAAVVLGALVEDVLGNETLALDRALLTAVHELVPGSWVPAFRAITFTGSFAFIAVCALLLCTAYWFAGHRRAAATLAATPAIAGALIYVAKTTIGRERPALWPTDHYWGSSFPSGHTLAAAALATAAYLVARHQDARTAAVSAAIGLTWVVAVAVSRLVLGVHWPTDVAAAACAGVLAAIASRAATGRLWPAERGR